ncbi:hypothetical protein CPSG_07885 [Coccidioides posadasii str. Silveira]|uniref:Uncharacterized protein n=1 Tax=Coccidioides posadasii (strain RMSCC 757 / Silveira) TaxID=443226 RepID=E9DE94_COCPS|nr:hypothetical protein CPSG_07885 [Coccidioides posadasii str. Silveira]
MSYRNIIRRENQGHTFSRVHASFGSALLCKDVECNHELTRTVEGISISLPRRSMFVLLRMHSLPDITVSCEKSLRSKTAGAVTSFFGNGIKKKRARKERNAGEEALFVSICSWYVWMDR